MHALLPCLADGHHKQPCTQNSASVPADHVSQETLLIKLENYSDSSLTIPGAPVYYNDGPDGARTVLIEWLWPQADHAKAIAVCPVYCATLQRTRDQTLETNAHSAIPCKVSCI